MDGLTCVRHAPFLLSRNFEGPETAFLRLFHIGVLMEPGLRSDDACVGTTDEERFPVMLDESAVTGIFENEAGLRMDSGRMAAPNSRMSCAILPRTTTTAPPASVGRTLTTGGKPGCAWSSNIQWRRWSTDTAPTCLGRQRAVDLIRCTWMSTAPCGSYTRNPAGSRGSRSHLSCRLRPICKQLHRRLRDVRSPLGCTSPAPWISTCPFQRPRLTCKPKRRPTSP